MQSPEKVSGVENIGESTNVVRSLEVVTMDESVEIPNKQLDTTVVESNQSQNEDCDAPTAFNTAVELFSDTTKNSVSEMDASPVFSSVNTDKVNLQTDELSEKGAVNTDQDDVSNEDSRALQNTNNLVQSSEVNIADVSTRNAHSQDVTHDSSLTESDGHSSEYVTTDISLQYLTDEGN